MSAPSTAPHPVTAFLSFSVQVLIGAVTFLLVYLVALLVAAGIDHLNLLLHAPQWLQGVGTALEMVIFAADALGLILLIVYETSTLIGSLWASWRRPHG